MRAKKGQADFIKVRSMLCKVIVASPQLKQRHISLFLRPEALGFRRWPAAAAAGTAVVVLETR